MDERTRAWSVVALGLLSAILIYILVRTPPAVEKTPPPQPQVQAGPVRPKSPGPVEEPSDPYRGWPFFFGWPLPEGPQSGRGTGGSEEPGPILPAPTPMQPMVPLPGEEQ